MRPAARTHTYLHYWRPALGRELRRGRETALAGMTSLTRRTRYEQPGASSCLCGGRRDGPRPAVPTGCAAAGAGCGMAKSRRGPKVFRQPCLAASRPAQVASHWSLAGTNISALPLACRPPSALTSSQKPCTWRTGQCGCSSGAHSGAERGGRLEGGAGRQRSAPPCAPWYPCRCWEARLRGILCSDSAGHEAGQAE